MTVLDRLHDKGFVDRDKSGRAFLYRPRVRREALMAERAASALSNKGLPQCAVLMAFLDSVESRDPKLLDRLAELIEARRSGR
jgi:predicted transcriptional regulator